MSLRPFSEDLCDARVQLLTDALTAVAVQVDPEPLTGGLLSCDCPCHRPGCYAPGDCVHCRLIG